MAEADILMAAANFLLAAAHFLLAAADLLAAAELSGIQGGSSRSWVCLPSAPRWGAREPFGFATGHRRRAPCIVVVMVVDDHDVRSRGPAVTASQHSNCNADPWVLLLLLLLF